MHLLKTRWIFSALCGVLPLFAAETTLEFDPPKAEIHWTLDTLLHTVHGTFRLRSGTVSFDPATGHASGALIVDARSGQSGSSSRDSRMHSSILESAKFGDIVFRPDRVDGQIPKQGAGAIRVHGQFELHGQSHELTLPIEIDVEDRQIGAKTHFLVPYIAWGLKNPSTFILKVNEKVDIDLTATGRIAAKGAQ
ncbi:MAG: YceI family protein [Bryobacteraceae bacterium]|nr:YceI family protein [Bryobacteraceae bacterium]